MDAVIPNVRIRGEQQRVTCIRLVGLSIRDTKQGYPDAQEYQCATQDTKKGAKNPRRQALTFSMPVTHVLSLDGHNTPIDHPSPTQQEDKAPETSASQQYWSHQKPLDRYG
jgi:hypothetical protein